MQDTHKRLLTGCMPIALSTDMMLDIDNKAVSTKKNKRRL
jgi:hypothetical protein